MEYVKMQEIVALPRAPLATRRNGHGQTGLIEAMTRL